MYDHLVALNWFGTWTMFVLGCILPAQRYLIGVAFADWLIGPFLLDIFYSLASKIINYDDIISLKKAKRYIPIIYHKRYNITACGLENMHPFDSIKYKRIVNFLSSEGTVNKKIFKQFYSPSLCGRSLLVGKMDMLYLATMGYSTYITKYVEVPICMLPAFIIRYRVLNPMLRATKGSIDGAILAVEHSWAINLSGGYHHAHCSGGGGFCLYPDITLAIHHLRRKTDIKRVAIIDLDAHQGNGHGRDFLNDPNTFIVDAYNHGIYPNDVGAKAGISYDIRVSYETDEEYLEKLEGIEEKLKEFKPEFILYNAGTDCMRGDPLGNMNVSSDGIIQRDELIFNLAFNVFKIPILMVLSGGYQESNAPCIAESIANLNNKFNLFEKQF